MRLKVFLSVSAPAALLVSSTLLYPTPLNAATSAGRAPGAPAAASYTWNFRGEANALFGDMQVKAQQARDQAETMQGLLRDEPVTWEGQSGQLTQIKSEVNDLGQKLCRVETIRGMLAPWQRKVVDRISPQVRLMADNAQGAIVFADAHQERLWSPAYRACVDNLQAEAAQLAQSTSEGVQYARVLGRSRRLRREIGVSGS